MNPIRKVVIENFQSHKYTVIQPAEAGQLTVITGPSDGGKTSVIRALRWVFFNAPLGIDFIRVGTTFARVTLEFESGDTVVRWRSTGAVNRYLVNGEIYEGFGSGVPLEVQQVTGVKTVSIGDMELNLNIAEQLQGPFLGNSVSAPARAKVLGKLAGTEEVDYAGKQLATDLHRRNQDEKRLAVELAGLKEQIKKFDYLPMIAEKIVVLEKIAIMVKATQERRQKLAEQQEALRQVDAGITAAQVSLRRLQYLDLAEYTLGGAEKILANTTILRQAANRLLVTDEAIRIARGTLAKLVGLEAAQDTMTHAEVTLRRQMRVRQLEASMVGVDSNILAAQSIAAKHSRLTEAEETARQAAATMERRLTVIRVGGLYRQVAGALRQSEEAAQRLARLEEAGALQVAAEAFRKRQEKIIDFAIKARQMEAEERKARQSAAFWEQRVCELEGAYKDELVTAGKCPVCGGQINPEKLKEVV